MSLELDDIPAVLSAALAADAALAAVPFIAQVAATPDDVAAIKAYNDRLNTALAAPGVALVCIMVDGDDQAGKAPALILANRVLLCVVDNEAKNATGQTAWQYTRRALRVLKRYQAAARGARADIALDSPSYQLGPIGKGTTTYFLNLVIRTAEDLGPVTA